MVSSVASTAVANAKEGAESADALALAGLLEGDQASTQLGAAIKAVFDRGMQATYEQALNKHVRIQNTQIKNICNQHYEEFIESIDSLVTLKSDIRELRDDIVRLNDGVQASGDELLSTAEELGDLRRMQINIGNARVIINRCVATLGLLSKAQSQISEGKLFPALKTIAQLQKESLRPLQSGTARNSSLVAAVDRDILPGIIGNIKDKVRNDFEKWLTAADEKASKIGAWAIVNMEKVVRNEMDKDTKRRHQRLKALCNSAADADGDLDVSHLSSAVCDAVDLGVHAGEEDLFERIQFDFAPVYQALHIYETLNEPDIFAAFYFERRAAQVTKCVEFTRPEDDSKFLMALSSYFSQCAGLFIIEESIFKSGNRLISRADLSALWELFVSKMKVALLEQLMQLSASADLLELKHQVVLFCRTMDVYSFNVAPLISFIASHRDKYEELLTARFRADLEKIFSKEKYEPLTIDTPETFRKFVTVFGLDANLPAPDGPRTFPVGVPFSGTVPLICRTVKHFVADYFAFTMHLPDMFVFIRRALDDILMNLVNARLNEIIDNSPSLNVSQAVQIAVNADYLVTACLYWERLTLVFNDPKYYIKPFTLSARTSFGDLRTRAEDLIFEVIERKINEMLDLMNCNLDWCPQNVQSGPNDSVQMLVSFLETTMSAQYMPAHVRTAVHFASCRSISRTLLQFAASAKQLNVLAMYNLEQDVKHLEAYANNTGIPNLHEAFAEVRQLIALFLNPNVEQLLDDNVRRTRFPLIPVSKMCMFLDKFKETAFLSVVPADVPRVAKKNVENVVRRLRHSP
ncbi:Exocyst complex component [Plasmodiophora brassicae]